jgi:methionine-S-sulfoxide reductase
MNTITLAGGCFWCIEHDLRHLTGVMEAVSGYATDDQVPKNIPTYHNHNGFREAVQITYDENQTSFKKIVQFFLDHIDPTDAGGQFHDRGESYKTAIYFTSSDEQQVAQALLAELGESGIYDQPIAVQVLSFGQFFTAEDYHQNYAEKNPAQYAGYRTGSGRAAFVGQVCEIREQKKIVWKD